MKQFRWKLCKIVSLQSHIKQSDLHLQKGNHLLNHSPDAVAWISMRGHLHISSFYVFDSVSKSNVLCHGLNRHWLRNMHASSCHGDLMTLFADLPGEELKSKTNWFLEWKHSANGHLPSLSIEWDDIKDPQSLFRESSVSICISPCFWYSTGPVLYPLPFYSLFFSPSLFRQWISLTLSLPFFSFMRVVSPCL